MKQAQNFVLSYGAQGKEWTAEASLVSHPVLHAADTGNQSHAWKHLLTDLTSAFSSSGSSWLMYLPPFVRVV